ncbi:helix-turn-helix transcriptional regulator [Novosphingobium sp. BL-52-GroH]|uniref:helix-turn-helix domain-containing protein n=1 Tax=Novosphingobium sp. BL-52-GroH TaxID=3349877 RepID=UPI00384D319C
MINIGHAPDVEKYRERLALLTIRQRECMLLADQGHSGKAIAKALGISPSRVEKHILEARRILGNLPRREGARLVAAYEAGLGRNCKGGQLLGALSLPLDPIVQIGPIGPEAAGPVLQDEPAGPPGRPGSTAGHEHAPGPMDLTVTLSALRSYRRQGNDLDTRSTLISIAILSAAALVAAGSAVTLLDAFGSLSQP